ncbi:MAG: condensin complex non-SMC subunit Cnd3 [Amphiamblys sp. WSBS2006]|nr:MAG: condensin complex non-SMC subunit Cnd3 [Amphiamblys sp. WSBS2006]
MVISADAQKTKICRIFTDANRHLEKHNGGAKALLAMLRAAVEEEETDVFLSSLTHCLAVYLGESRVSDKTECFLGTFFSNCHREEICFNSLLEFVFRALGSKTKTVRLRACALLEKIHPTIHTDTETWTLFRERTTERLLDREAAVRERAVALSVALLETPAGLRELPEILASLLEHDPSPGVRTAVLRHAPAEVFSSHLPGYLERASDASPAVRKAFHGSLRSLPADTFSAAQTLHILRTGLNDEEQTVRAACADFLTGTLVAFHQKNLIQLMLALEWTEDTATAELVLCCFFGAFPAVFTSFTDDYFHNLTKETVFLFRALCERTAEYIPELSLYIETLEKHYRMFVAAEDADEAEENAFIVHQLLLVAPHYSDIDEFSRRSLLASLRDILMNIELDKKTAHAAVMVLLRKTDPEEALQLCIDTLNTLVEIVDGCSEIPDETRALSQIRTLTILHCLASEATNLPSIIPFISKTVVPAVNSDYAAVQLEGLKCLSLFVILDDEIASEHLPLFVDFYTQGNDETKTHAVGLLFDFACVNGLENAERIFGNIRAVLQETLEDDSVSTMAVEGFAKLFLLDGTTDVPVLASLFLSQNPEIQPCLDAFFPAFFFSARKNQALLGENFLEIARHFVERAKKNSFIDAILKQKTPGISAWVEKLISLTDTECLATPDDGPSIHAAILENTLDTLAEDPSAENAALVLSRCHKMSLKQSEIPAIREKTEALMETSKNPLLRKLLSFLQEKNN